MRARVIKLRERGILTELPPLTSELIGRYVTEGLLQYGTPQGEHRGKCLMLRTFQSSPGMGVRLKLYQPTLADIRDDFIRLRGFEAAQAGDKTVGYMQEWLVFLT